MEIANTIDDAMSNHLEKANEYGVESLKLIMTLSSASLVLTITFLKDVIGDADPAFYVLVVLGWIALLLSIFFSWFTIAAASIKLGTGDQTVFVFANDKREVGHPFFGFLWFFPTLLAWFIPLIPSRQKNEVLKYAASAQNYFVLGLLLIGLFSAVNFKTTPPEKINPEQADVEQLQIPLKP